MKLNLQKTTAAVLAVLLSAGVFAANNANAFEYGYKNHKYGKKWGKPASEAEGERVMKNAAYRSGVYYTNVNRIPARADRNGVKTVQVNDAPKAPTAAFTTQATNALLLCRYLV